MSDLEGSLEIALRFESQGRVREALAVATLALEQKPAHAAALLMAGRCLCALEKPLEAAPLFRRAADACADPLKKAKALCQQAEALAAGGDDRGARGAYADATRADAELPWGWFGHGAVCLRLSEFKEAERSLAESYRMRPDGETALLLGLARLSLGKLKEAQADLKEAARLRPELKARVDRAVKEALS